MSAAPRPNSLPSRSVGTNGSDSQRSSGPVGTTSVWPAKHTSGDAVPRRAQRLVTPPLASGSRRKPSGRRRAASTSWQPPSSGVIERRAISSRASASVSLMKGEKPGKAFAPDYKARSSESNGARAQAAFSSPSESLNSLNEAPLGAVSTFWSMAGLGAMACV